MDFLIVIISLSLFLNVRLHNIKDCPNKTQAKTCSPMKECESGFTCYRDIQMNATHKGFSCCKSSCPNTNMPYGRNYQEDSESMESFCSNLTSDFYFDMTDSEDGLSNEEYACCPKPYSEFVYGRHSKSLVDDKYVLPANWSIDSKGIVAGITQCCSAQDCPPTEYCGKVRNPATMKLVERFDYKCRDYSKYDKNNQFLGFCYTYPDVNYESLRISKREKNFLIDVQLCKDNRDCWNTTHYCKPADGNSSMGSCSPIIGSLITSRGAKDAFLVHGIGCKDNQHCDDLGLKWFSYQCEHPDIQRKTLGRICVGYEIMCSESALHPHGIHFGCKTDKDCDGKLKEKDSVHTPKCVENPFVKNETACCYEMKSCRYKLDITPYGIPPLKSSMCKSDGQCKELAEDMMNKQPAGKRDILLGRCMPELEGNFGKCCIADITTHCSVGQSFLPPKKCSSHLECGFDEIKGIGWCGDEGYCCEDFEEKDKSWMCPDGKTIRLYQPKCDWFKDGDWCEGKSGYCTLNRCCPAVSRSGESVYTWAESPWYYNNLTCSDTKDIPPNMTLVYCDPEKHVVTGMPRFDQWSSPIQVALYTYCSSNNDCSSISDSLVCVRETEEMSRCHTYYDRPMQWYPPFVPIILFAVLLWRYICVWHRGSKYDSQENIELYL